LAVPRRARAVDPDKPLIVKFSHVVAPETPKGKAAARFAQLAEQRTGGRVRVHVYPNSLLYKDREELEALQLGAVQMLAPSLAKFAPLGLRDFELFDLPFIFSDYAELRRVTQGPIGRRLLERLSPKGIVGLAYWDNGFKQMSANRPLRRPADFRGLKMRIQPSQVIEAQMRALGASALPMAFSDVYEALRNGVVDGTENPVSNFYTQRMHEVQPYLTLSDHGYLGYAVIVNKRFWDGLPSDLRASLESALQDATAYANDIARRENDAALQAVRASGRTAVITLTADERHALKRALLPVHREFEQRIGSELIQRVYQATGFRAESS
jgi:C4-dicarboxylate-binding protein DctP